MAPTPTATKATNQGVQVISRAAEILRVLKRDPGGLSLGQIADRVGLPRSTVQRIVGALSEEGLVASTSPERGLRLGPEIQSLAAAAGRDIAELVRPFLRQISEETGETVDLATFHQNRMVFVDQIVGSQRLRTVSAVGESFPLSTTANGKAALALLELERAAQLVEAETAGTGRNAAELLAELATVRETGVAWDLNEHTDGICAVGAAFRDPAGSIAAVSIPVPSHRFTAKKRNLALALRRTIGEIGASLRSV